MRYYSNADLLLKLKTLCAAHGQSYVAVYLGVSKGHINDVFHGNRPLGDALCRKMGYEKSPDRWRKTS